MFETDVSRARDDLLVSGENRLYSKSGLEYITYTLDGVCRVH